MPTQKQGRDKVDEVLRLHDSGKIIREISEITGVHRNTVGRWIKGVRSPVDPVAIERALGGDRKVYQSLTREERQEFLRQAHAKSQASWKEATEWDRVQSYDNPWLDWISFCLGADKTALSKAMWRAARK